MMRYAADLLASYLNGASSWEDLIEHARLSALSGPAAVDAWLQALESEVVRNALPDRETAALRTILGAKPEETAAIPAVIPPDGSNAASARGRDSPTRERRPEDTYGHRPRADPVEPETARSGERVINGRYVLEARLGGGGMGEVFRARDLTAERHHSPNPYVALKRLNPEIRDDEQARIAMHREVERSRMLKHPNIVGVFAFDEDQADETPFFTMELLQGQSLEEILAERTGGMPLSEAAPLIRALSAGLDAAHGERIVHSDIKPSNVFITESGVVKILDFGIAAPLRDPEVVRASAATRLRAKPSQETHYDPRRLGALSPGYAPLEMWMGLSADRRDDVYSAACVIYQLLSGRHPYYDAVQGRPLEAPQAFEQGIAVPPLKQLSDAQNAVLKHALALKREDRLGSMKALGDGLLTAGGGRSGFDLRRWAPAIIAGTLAALLAVAALRVWQRSEPDAGSETVPVVAEATPGSGAVTIDSPKPEGSAVPDASTPLPYSPLPGLPAAADACADPSLTCGEQQACLATRAREALAGSMVAPEATVALFEARAQMHSRLAGTPCNLLDAERAREYATFRARFAGTEPY